MSLDDYELASMLVRNAGQLALRMRSDGLTATQKTSVSDVVTAADKAAEQYVLEQLSELRPDDGVLGEEGTSRAGTSGRTWVIDPVDGTYNFFSGSTYWCSALALRADSDAGSTGGAVVDGTASVSDLDAVPDPDVILGAIYQPQEDKLWLGGKGRPATLNGQTLAPPSNAEPDQLSAGSYLHPGWLAEPRAADPWRAAALLSATIRMWGSGSCDLGRVAEGQLGFWFQHSCPQWDWLPGKAIVLAAGGDTAVVNVNGLDWFIAGGATAVARVSAALTS